MLEEGIQSIGVDYLTEWLREVEGVYTFGGGYRIDDFPRREILYINILIQRGLGHDVCAIGEEHY